jgi:hypothetical protein
VRLYKWQGLSKVTELKRKAVVSGKVILLDGICHTAMRVRKRSVVAMNFNDNEVNDEKTR